MDNRTALYAMQKFQQLGYSPVSSAAIVGNLAAESKLNPNATGDNGTSHGIAQWHNERWRMMDQWTKQHGMDPNSLDGQIHYLDWELKNRYQGVYNQLRNSNDLKSATAAFTTGFERPAGSQNGAEASAGWGSRIGHAMTFASLATGKPMSDFAASGWTPPQGGSGASPPTDMAMAKPAEVMPQEVAVAPPESAMASGSGGEGGLIGGEAGSDMSDLSGLAGDESGAIDTKSASPETEAIGQKVALEKQMMRNGFAEDPTKQKDLASLFQLPNIGQAPVMQQQAQQMTLPALPRGRFA